MPTPDKNSHALLSPSGASRWLACTPSARLEAQFPDTAGVAAEEGTLAHKLGEALTAYHHQMLPKAEYAKIIKEVEADPLYNLDMAGHAENYAAFIAERFAEAKARTKDAVLQLESCLNMTEYVPEGYGTGDTVIIADHVLEIIDLKYGKGVRVSCEQNRQMMLYALGALRDADYLYNIDTVLMTIYQPRLDNISSFEMSVKDLKDWAENELRPRAALAFEGLGEFVPGDHCRFCRARFQCKALADYNLELAKYDFQDPVLLTDADISDILKRAEAFTNWLSGIEEFALREAIDGKKWDGFKLVEGRSNRCYQDETLVADKLVSNGYSEDTIYTKKLLGITAMEKAITKKEFSSLLSDLVIKPAGKPTLVPSDNKRPAWNSTESAINDFTNPE